MNTALATMGSTQERQTKDITEQRQTQIIVANQLLEVSKQLARIDTMVGDIIRDGAKPRR